MNQVIKYDKTLQERLHEYLEIFDNCSSVHEIKHNLSAYLEMEMDHCGWQAIWKIPRIGCENLKIPFPTFALVFVVNMNCVKHVAEVRVLYTPCYITLEESHIVPLVQLWLTREQDSTVALNLESTGNALDVLQFFYTNLYMPWDDEDNSNWIQNHLEQRLRLFYDIKNGVVPQSMAERFKFLLTEVKRLHAKCLIIQRSLKEQNVDIEDESNEELNEILELQVRLMEVRKEIELLENPIARKVFIKRYQMALKQKEEQQEEKKYCLVCEGEHEDCVVFLEKLKSLYPVQKFKTTISLTAALENPDIIQLLAISPGKHNIKEFTCLDIEASINGIFEKEKTIISSISQNIMFDLSGYVTFENLTIDATKSQCAILIRSGKVVLKNCRIIGDNVSITHQGFIVLKGSSLELIDCCIAGFGTGIVGNSNSNIKISNSEIYGGHFGFKIHDDCNVEILDCVFHSCMKYAVLMETDNNLYGNEEQIGDFSLLKSVPNVILKSTRGTNNNKDVMICPTFKVQPMCDVFSHPSVLNKTAFVDLDDSSDEESTEFNNTVIEIGCI